MVDTDTPTGRRVSGTRRALTVLLVTGIVALGFEVLLRVVLTYNIDYYTLRTDPGSYELAYGTVRINSFGYPDEEWDLEDPRPRVAYVGDSVVFGTGAGYGYRFSDLLADARPWAQHLTFASTQQGIHNPSKLLELADRFSLSTVVYAMNLNDVMATRRPRGAGGTGGRTPMRILFAWVRKADGLRGVSYLYNYSRSRLRNVLRRRGYVASGRKAVEFYPHESRQAIRETAERINRAATALRERGVELCVLLLPYEMQISEDAARRYRELGIRWEDGFLERGTQRELIEDLDPDIEILDAYFAFVRAGSIERDRAGNGLGEFFVYNRGDKIDYNHPTRIGQRKIAEYAIRQRFCETPERPGGSAVTRRLPGSPDPRSDVPRRGGAEQRSRPRSIRPGR